MDFKNLYLKAVNRNIVGWNVATEPTEDAYAVEEVVTIDYNKALKKFIAKNEEHPVSTFLKESLFSDALDKKKIQSSQKLWKKYQKMKKDKLPADKEYYKLFDNMIAVTQQMLHSKKLTHSDLMFFNDKRLGDPAFILSVVERMANISSDFIRSKTINNEAVRREVSHDELMAFLESFEDIDYKISNKNGSFMTALDANNSRIHIAKNKKCLFDTVSSTTHEVGHALYQNRVLSKNTEIGKLGDSISLSLHESSSIFHEISLSGINFNIKEQHENLFRLGTDKVHYIIHIYIRMKIESMLFQGTIKAKDISKTWNALIKEYIGMEPENDWDGFLQDVHWNSGAFGYFHSYAIGFFNAVLMFDDIKPLLTDDMVKNTNDIILPKIVSWYGHFNESSHDILKTMHPDIESSLARYREFIFGHFNYQS